MGETGYYFMIAFGLSIMFMYLILAAQFESWTQPISILMALPVTIPFGLLSLVLFRTPMDIYAMFGLFMLVGIVKKNGILQVDATNQLRRRGMPRHEAIIEANHTRLRPILMTTVMLVAAMVPIALGQGPGAGRRASMAKVIIGGQMLSLVLALLVTPVFYALLDMWVNLTRRMGIRFSVEPRPEPQAGTRAPSRGGRGLTARKPRLPRTHQRALRFNSPRREDKLFGNADLSPRRVHPRRTTHEEPGSRGPRRPAWPAIHQGRQSARQAPTARPRPTRWPRSPTSIWPRRSSRSRRRRTTWSRAS